MGRSILERRSGFGVTQSRLSLCSPQVVVDFVKHVHTQAHVCGCHLWVYIFPVE